MKDSEIGDNSAVEVDYDELRAFLDELTGKRKAISEATGSLRQRIAEIIEQTGWHKKALADIRSIEAMSETARADYLRSFEPLFDEMVSKKWRDEQQDLFNDDTETVPSK